MTGMLLEFSVLTALVAGFRRLCRNVVSMRVIYAMWLVPALRMLPFELVWGRGARSVILDLCSGAVSLLAGGEYARFDFRAIRIPWYLLVLWAVGSVLVFLWEFFVNVRFERFLYDNRVRVADENCPYPIYQVSGLSSSCVFKVRGKAGIYLKKEVLEEPEVYRVVVSHEICHIRAGDLFWAKLRLLLVAVYWFNPLVYAAAVLSKEDCEMACDERTVALLRMRKSRYGKILLDAVSIQGTKTKDDVFCATTMMASSSAGFRVRIGRLAAKEHNRRVSFLAGGAFALCCILLCFRGRTDLRGMSGEETIRQYVWYSNADYQEGMKRLSLYDEWDYFFPDKLEGELLGMQKVNAGESMGSDKNYKKEVFEVKLKQTCGETVRQEERVVLLVKQNGQDDWKIDWRG